MEMIKGVPGELIFLGYRGSIAHGTHVPPEDPQGIDDKDAIGVFIAPREHYLGLKRSKETIERVSGEWDIVLYEVRHFLRLLLHQNPNVLSTLWLRSAHVIFETWAWQPIFENRQAFVSKKAYNSFVGYANGQLKKMTRFPAPVEERERAIKVLKEEVKYREHRSPKERSFLHHLYQTYSMQDLRTGLNALKGQTGYMGAKRKSLVEEHGYDPKNGAHLVRLLKMCIEFLMTGEMQVDRTGIDADQLIAIKRGEWSLYAVEQLGKTLFGQARDAREASTLPDQPDLEVANELCMNVVKHAV